ncbi:M91 family zinc metallopeptidase [Stackebrandtia nassauensis]|uniref:Hemolysin-type calcium-binding region n=1 Tax=Stackebrandtia nassauensis (strain DSM 44728 / CIP 108903 / NRRL B-16338 / NBRC 102104 / LLR-40K-21) TaxID=446470 RepID=D3Q3P0_STANL|nr:M91 family zinc metallopeptidase [Stackebrandtia nassauensis]ADD43957.1 Hemolysin-type calcium-binding region [Stackebrandtia nassauensis DSM 44728]
MPEPHINVDTRYWNLEGNPGKLEKAATAWRELAKVGKTSADNVETASNDLVNGKWAGDCRDSFAEHRKTLIGSLDGADTRAGEIAGHLDGIAALQRKFQGFLTEALGKITGAVPNMCGANPPPGGSILTFMPENPEQSKAVLDSVEKAKKIRKSYDDELGPYAGKFDESKTKWEKDSKAWEAIVENQADPFTVPPEADKTSVIMVDGKAVVNTGSGNDKVNVTTDKDGNVKVEVNGVVQTFPPGTPVVVRGGEGNDVITVDKNTKVNLTLLGGDGNDRVHSAGGADTIVSGHGKDDVYAGEGNDYVSSGSGIDYVDGQDGNDDIGGGTGNDTLYGLGGDDYINGGEDADYLEGAKGNDTIDGGTGPDIISGGKGDDTLRGGGTGTDYDGYDPSKPERGDVFYGGEGKDDVTAGSGKSDAYIQDGDSTHNVDKTVTVEISDAGGFIKFEGSDEFKERMQADLDMMRSSPTAQQMLEGLESKRDPNFWGGEHSLTIVEQSAAQDGGSAESGDESIWGNKDSKINMNPGYTPNYYDGRSSTVLYHEMAHVYDFWNNGFDDTPYHGDPNGQNKGTEQGERTAVGLEVDHDHDSNTPDKRDDTHPWELTENALRDEYNLPKREEY